MRQVLEGDRKIRAVSLLKFSGISLADIDSAIQSEHDASVLDAAAADIIVNSLLFNQIPSTSDANILYYISGAIARSVVRVTKCDDCREVLVTSTEIEPMEVEESQTFSASTFLDSINRGGLIKPTDYCFMTVTQCWQIYEEIRQTTELNEKLLKVTNQRLLFVNVMERASSDGQLLMTSCFCNKGHDLSSMICRRFFNCVAKNLVKDITAKANSSKPPAKKRKIAKLTSQCHN